MSYTTDDLLKSVKRGISTPNFQALISDEDVLAFGNEEIDTVILPMLINLRSEFLVTMVEVPLIANKEKYDIPYRAVARKLREVHYRIDTNGQIVRDLPYVNPEDAYMYTNIGTTGDPRGFYVRGDKVVLIPIPQSAVGALQFFYEQRPGRLVATTQAAQVVSVDTVANQLTLSTIPSDISLNVLVDVNQNAPGNSNIMMDTMVIGISGNTVTLDLTLDTSILAGDWVSLAETTPLLQIPQECFQVLAQAVQCRVLEALGDTEGYQISKSRFDEKFKQVQMLLAPRVEGENMKVINRNSLLRRRNSLRLYTKWL